MPEDNILVTSLNKLRHTVVETNGFIRHILNTVEAFGFMIIRQAPTY